MLATPSSRSVRCRSRCQASTTMSGLAARHRASSRAAAVNSMAVHELGSCPSEPRAMSTGGWVRSGGSECCCCWGPLPPPVMMGVSSGGSCTAAKMLARLRGSRLPALKLRTSTVRRNLRSCPCPCCVSTRSFKERRVGSGLGRPALAAPGRAAIPAAGGAPSPSSICPSGRVRERRAPISARDASEGAWADGLGAAAPASGPRSTEAEASGLLGPSCRGPGDGGSNSKSSW